MQTRSLAHELMALKERKAHAIVPGGQEKIDQIDKLANLLQKLFVLAPEKRLAANEALKEKFFKKKK